MREGSRFCSGLPMGFRASTRRKLIIFGLILHLTSRACRGHPTTTWLLSASSSTTRPHHCSLHSPPSTPAPLPAAEPQPPARPYSSSSHRLTARPLLQHLSSFSTTQPWPQRRLLPAPPPLAVPIREAAFSTRHRSLAPRKRSPRPNWA